MKAYLVGGAVRDQLLGLPPIERDWVVVGSTPEEMLSLGFRPVGKDFPVFLHPQTHEEYALARTERKTGRGYTQFAFHASPKVTLEEDLRRRDFTINAMAMTDTGEIIDPFGGQKDLQAKILRHVSQAFIEDPVRILRAARLMARLASLGFTIAAETYNFMREMVNNGEVDALVPDRVWAEFDRALSEAAPYMFFEVLQHCGALEKLFPELINIPPLLKGGRAKRGRIFASLRSLNAEKFATLMLNLTQHDIKTLCQRYPVPANYKELALIAHHTQPLFYQKFLSAEMLLELLEKTDAFRREKRFYQLLNIFKDSPQHATLKKAFHLTQKISADFFISQGITGKKLGEKIREKRLEVLQSL